MTIDKEISHQRKMARLNRVEYEVECNYYGKEVVDRGKKPKCLKRAEECEQIAEWLEELKALRNNNYKDFYYDKGYSKAENDYHKQSEKDRQSAYELGYINAINDFKKEIIDMVNDFPTVENNSGEIRPMRIEEICEIIVETRR